MTGVGVRAYGGASRTIASLPQSVAAAEDAPIVVIDGSGRWMATAIDCIDRGARVIVVDTPTAHCPADDATLLALAARDDVAVRLVRPLSEHPLMPETADAARHQREDVTSLDIRLRGHGDAATSIADAFSAAIQLAGRDTIVVQRVSAVSGARIVIATVGHAPLSLSIVDAPGLPSTDVEWLAAAGRTHLSLSGASARAAELTIDGPTSASVLRGPWQSALRASIAHVAHCWRSGERITSSPLAAWCDAVALSRSVTDGPRTP